MRRSLLSLIVVMVVTVSARAQSDKQSDPNQNGPFQTELQQQLSKYKHGDFLYRRCDIFKKIIDRRIAVSLGTESTIEAPADAGDVGISSDISHSSSDENETSIAINRANPNLIIAGANDAAMYNVGMPIYFSSNAGQSWSTIRMPALHVDACAPGGDPMVIAGPDSLFYYAYLIYDNDAVMGNAGISDIIVARSTNGRAWTYGRTVMNKLAAETTFEDKESIAVDLDPASPYYGRLYVVWVHYDDNFGNESQSIAWSDDHGDSWSEPQIISDSTGYFSSVRVGGHGTVYVSSSSLNHEQLHSLMVSTNGGESFQRRIITDYASYPTNADARPGLKGLRGFRAFPYTSFDVDRSTNTIYLAYCTYEDTSAAIYTVTSTNDGLNWSEPEMIGRNGFTDLDHFLPWVTYDQEKRVARAAFYSSEDDPRNKLTRFSGVAFGSLWDVKPLGADLFNPLSVTKSGQPFIGDYVGADACAGYYAASWTENRTGHNDGDVFAYIETPQSGVTLSKINTIGFDISEAYPSPVVGNDVSFTITSEQPKTFVVTLCDILGRSLWSRSERVDAGSHAVHLSLPNLSAGTYHVVFSCDGEAAERALPFGLR